LEVGGVVVGDVPSWRVDHMPYGGVKNSGLGREGIRFAMEELASDVLYGTVIEANEQRFDAAAIRRLYESGAYPLIRRAAV
jgi:acyl-CoA reductase-like NAD-dependent aldehyde dehydrogenase